MKIILYISTALAALSLASCGAPKVLQEIQRDSTTVIIRDTLTFRDTIVLAPIPQEADKAKLPDTDTSRLETSVAVSEAYVNAGRLFHTLENKQEKLRAEVKLPEKIHTEIRTIEKETETIIEVEKKLSKWQQTLIGLGWAAIGCITGLLLFGIIKLTRFFR